MHHFFGYLLVIIGLLELGLALITLSRLNQDRAFGRSVFIALLATSAYALLAGVTYLRAAVGYDYSWTYRMAWIGFAAAPAVIEMVLRSKNSIVKWQIYCARSLYVAWAYILYLAATSELIDVAPNTLIPYTEILGKYEVPARIFAALQIIYVLFESLHIRKNVTGLKKSRIGYILLGLSLYGASALIASTLVQSVAGLRFDPALTSLFSIFFAVPIAYATLRQRLFDLRILISRILVSTLSTLTFFLIHTITFTVLSGSTPNMTALIAAAIVVGVVAFMSPLYEWLQNSVEFLVRGNNKVHREILSDFTDLVMHATSLDDLLTKTGESLQAGLGASSFAIFLNENDRLNARILSHQVTAYAIEPPPLFARTFENLKEALIHEELFIETKATHDPSLSFFTSLEPYGKFEVIAPLLCRGALVGIIGIGIKTNGSAYSREDIALINSMASQIALSVENSRLFNEAVEDGLTGLFHQKYFKARLTSEVSRLRRYHDPLALFLIDIDHFKIINDTYGHVAGDEVLAKLGKILKVSFRGEDVVSRYGGEEFAILLIQPKIEQVVQVAERLREKISREFFSQNFNVTVSIGIYVSSQEDLEAASDINSLIDRADKALYNAKRNGRDQVVLYGREHNILIKKAA